MFKIKTEKLIFFTTIIILLITIIPLLNYSNYIHPYTDEYAFSAIPHNVWKNSGSILEVIKASAKQTITNYYSWQGSFSAVFLFGLNPLSFSYESYKIVGYFLILSFTFSFLFFMFNLLNKVFNIEKITSASVANIVIILITATLPEIGEHFYYYISGIYYNFFISLAFIAFGFLIIFLTNNQKQFFIYKILIIFLFAFISGGNYPVVLISLCILTLIFISCIINNRKETYLVISLSLLLLLIGFIISIIAPGNSARQELQLNSPMNPFLAIIKSIIYCAYLWLKYLPL
ncbi:MAG: hypothetical protein GYA87_10205, partial [Christensenellaceae bacterium]|nr:hypothetical protein [Christensenellaceae bacterium]